MEYTKGEWKAISVPFENGQQYVVCNGKTLASVKTKLNDHDLIAAAPALYEACKEVAKAYKCSPTSMQPLFWLRCVQALSKVEGK